MHITCHCRKLSHESIIIFNSIVAKSMLDVKSSKKSYKYRITYIYICVWINWYERFGSHFNFQLVSYVYIIFIPYYKKNLLRLLYSILLSNKIFLVFFFCLHSYQLMSKIKAYVYIIESQETVGTQIFFSCTVLSNFIFGASIHFVCWFYPKKSASNARFRRISSLPAKSILLSPIQTGLSHWCEYQLRSKRFWSPPLRNCKSFCL